MSRRNSAKGADNFRNPFRYSPNGKKDDIQIILQSEAAIKDELLSIRNISLDDMMAALLVPPQKRLQELNDWLGEEMIRFDLICMI